MLAGQRDVGQGAGREIEAPDVGNAIAQVGEPHGTGAKDGAANRRLGLIFVSRRERQRALDRERDGIELEDTRAPVVQDVQRHPIRDESVVGIPAGRREHHRRSDLPRGGVDRRDMTGSSDRPRSSRAGSPCPRLRQSSRRTDPTPCRCWEPWPATSATRRSRWQHRNVRTRDCRSSASPTRGRTRHPPAAGCG